MNKVRKILLQEKFTKFVIYGIGQGFNLISPLLVIPYIVYICGESGYGKVNLGFSMALFLILIVDYGFEIKAPKEISESRDNPVKLQEIANTTFYSKFIIFLLVFFCINILVQCIPFLYNERLLYIFSSTIILAQVFSPSWFLQGLENFKIVSIINIASKVTYVVLVYVVLKNSKDYIYVNLLLGLSALLFNLGFLIYAVKKYNINLWKPNLGNIKTAIVIDFSLCVSQLFLSARQLSPTFIISAFLGYNAAGQYAIIERIIGMFRTFIQVFLRFFFPTVCYKISKDITDGFSFWKKYTGYGMILMTTGTAILYIFSLNVLLYFNLSVHDAVVLNPIFRIALLIPLVMSFSYPLEQLMFVVNKHKVYVKIIMSLALVTVVLSLTGVKSYGVISIVLSLLVSEIIIAVLYFKYSYHYLKKVQLSNNKL